MIKIILLLSLSLGISACLKSKPKELKSPCVAIDSNDNTLSSPCIRRKPINNDIA
jgi:Protein of unknown function (DUF2706)